MGGEGAENKSLWLQLVGFAMAEIWNLWKACGSHPYNPAEIQPFSKSKFYQDTHTFQAETILCASRTYSFYLAETSHPWIPLYKKHGTVWRFLRVFLKSLRVFFPLYVCLCICFMESWIWIIQGNMCEQLVLQLWQRNVQLLSLSGPWMPTGLAAWLGTAHPNCEDIAYTFLVFYGGLSVVVRPGFGIISNSVLVLIIMAKVLMIMAF